MAPASRSLERPMVDEYKEVLERFTHKVACQNRCDRDPTQDCSCLRHIIHVDALKQWWSEKLPGSLQQTKLERLLDEIPAPNHRTFPFTQPNKLAAFRGDQSCLTVFSLLLALNRADLIDIFYDSDMTDKRLDIVRDDSELRLHANLQKIKRHEVDIIWDQFHKERWAYCSLKLSLGMNRHLEGTKVIPPFCHKIPLSDKGATASIYWVAVQKDLITDESLKRAIQDSVYEDPDYGECYQMVLKTFCGDKKTFFDLEKEAFEGLPFDAGIPIVRYLGCYTHDYGDGSGLGSTYNLLLEFGERDLYQAWADETNVPPVRAEEIIRIWESLFGVAKAVRHLHNFEWPRRGSNAPLRYNGWHADIKPDNILVFRGKLKLADFGLSRFARKVRRPDGGLPTELVDGFTISYGAPEISRMRQPDGTVTGVTQSIDTWSFGCVLSVAATWLVMGFQGVRVFEQLRLQASPDKTDRFHDGFNVLPEIRRWHNFLRGHLRPSDTATSSVLDLIENNMLQAEPLNRMGLEELCIRLEDIRDRAIANVENLGVHSRTTDPTVLEALLAIEKQAQEEVDNKRRTITHPVIDINSLNPLQRVTMQLDRGNLFRSKPLGRTPYRREILEQQLRTTMVVDGIGARSTGAEHRGAFTHSPKDSISSEDAFAVTPPNQPRLRPRNPNHIQGAFANKAIVEDEPAQSSPHTLVPRPHRDGELPQQISNPNIQSAAKPEGHGYKMNGRLPYAKSTTAMREDAMSPPTPTPAPLRHARHSHNAPRSPTAGDMEPNWQHDAGRSRFDDSHIQPSHTAYANNLSYNAPYRSAGNSSYHDHEDRQQRHYSKHPAPPGLMIMTSPPGYNSQFEPPEDSQAFVPQDALSPEPLPSSVYSLPYDVCRVREELELQTPKGKLARVKSLMGKEERKRDQGLAETYGTGREIIFVIDNGSTMLEHWPIVVFVAETMVKKAAGLDKDGVDLRFTIDGAVRDKTGLKGDGGRREFRAALNAAEPENSENQDFKTDMYHTLNEIVRKWRANNKPATTLLVLTDGKWESTIENLVDNTILGIAAEMKGYSGPRSFSIQFIRFGDDCAAKLAKLDNELFKGHVFRDIVDHCSWRSTVEKMFKGSILGQHDEDDPEELPITFDYAALVALFRTYNNNIHQERVRPSLMLSPPNTPKRNSFSRSPGPGPSATSLNRSSSWQTHSRTPYSQQ